MPTADFDPSALSDLHESLRLVRLAHDLIRDSVHRTPTLECRSVSDVAGIRLRMKCENLQRGGSFKVRGALTMARALGDRHRHNGLITFSSGNHAQGVALAARATRTKAVVVMPEDVVPSKLAAVRSYGAEVVLCGRTSEDRRLRALEIREERDLVMIPPFDDPHIICGQGTVALELMEDWPDASVIFVPMGGGGLASGVALVAKALGAGTQVVGVEPAGAAKVTASLDAGERVTLESTDTVADGLRPLAVGALNWEVIRRFVDQVVTVTDGEIIDAVSLLLERAKLVVEPSGAAAVAAALKHAREYRGPAFAIVSGGNVDLGQVVARVSARLAELGA